ncbi:hypothetical protein J1N35_013973 [Gossypium stocksii]|uniref:Uncharacterized protein n=1 Tax=Gossypium stocksii TaxID=47602 RepID=A0A9D3VTE0_9ROSI|nr:hypothetical protein J1N35_013973 [Gossypium stocksii]
MEHKSGYWEVIQGFDILSDDREPFWRRDGGVVSWRSSTPEIRLHTASMIGGDPWDDQEGEVWD